MAVALGETIAPPTRIQAVHKTDKGPLGMLNDRIRVGFEEMHAHKPAEIAFMQAYGPKGINRIVAETTLGIQKRWGRAVDGFAERAENEVRLFALNTRFGQIWHDALNTIHQHGAGHSKFVEAGKELSSLAAPEIWMPTYVREASAGFAYKHDINQLIYEYYLKRNPDFLKVNPKIGHGPGGAVMALAMAMDEGARTQVGFTQERARKVAGTLALMIIPHDQPDSLKKALGPEGIQQYSSEEIITQGPVETAGERLVHALNNQTLDLFRLRVCDLMMLLHEIKSQAGFDTFYGLGREFEDQYKIILEGFAKDTSYLVGSVDKPVSGREKRAIRNATFLSVIPDVAAMISGESSFLRTLTVEKAKYIELFNVPELRDDITIEALDEQIIEQYGRPYWLELKHTLSPEEYQMAAIILANNGGGNRESSNAERKLWESLHLGDMLDGTDLARNPTIRAMVQDYQASSFSMIREVLTLFMGGDDTAIENHIHKVFTERIDAIAGKPGITQNVVDKWETELLNEAQHVITCLHQKPGSNGHIRNYGTDAIQSFQRISNAIELGFWILSGFRNGEIRRNDPAGENEWLRHAHMKMYEHKMAYAQGARAVAPVRRIDSTGDIGNARTIHPVRRLTDVLAA